MATPVTNAAPVKLTHFVELTDEEFAAYAKQTRTKTPSIYEQDLKDAVVGKGYSRPIPAGEVSRTIVNKITKAAKALDLKVQVIVREKATPPAVIFRVLPAVVEGSVAE